MSGAAPQSRQLHQVLRVLRGVRRRSELAGAALPAVSALVGAEVAGFNTWGPGGISARPVMVPQDAMLRADLVAYAQFRDQQPLIDFYQRRASAGPFRTSDVASLRDFQRTDLYHHFYRPLAIRYQLGLPIPEGGGWTTGYAFSRESRDYDYKAVDLMTSVAVALASAHHRVAAESLSGRFESVSRLLLDDNGDRLCCLVVIDERNRVDVAAGPLLPRVEARYGKIAPGSLAPARLARLATGSRVSYRLPVAIDHGDTADAISIPTPDGGGSLLFELRDPADLRARFGLTAGEYRTLANITRLETNERAAQAEGVSVPTIEKRISAVIRKMHVATRVGAVREYLRSKEQ